MFGTLHQGMVLVLDERILIFYHLMKFVFILELWYVLCLCHTCGGQRKDVRNQFSLCYPLGPMDRTPVGLVGNYLYLLALAL